MRWYRYLKSNENEKGQALFDYEALEPHNLIICQKLHNLFFGKFKNFLDFAKYMIKNTDAKERCFYETIFADTHQRPYFDIEFYTPSQEVIKDGALVLPVEEADLSVECLVNCIEEELKELSASILEESKKSHFLKLNMSHILVFTSHQEHKRSYHVVVEGFCFANCKENREFYSRVMRRMPDKWKNIVDHSMYKSIQQFRIFNNTKWKSERYKILNQQLTRNFLGKRGWISKIPIESEEHKQVLILEASLITQTSSCILLLCQVPETVAPKRYTSNNNESLSIDFNPLTSEEIKRAMELCAEKMDSFPFSYLKTIEDNGVSSLILLKRHKSSMCSVCNRAHENENPYLVIHGEEKMVYFDCRRNIENRKSYIGQLGKQLSKPPSPVIETQIIKSKPVSIIKVPEPVAAFNPMDFLRNASNMKIEKKEEKVTTRKPKAPKPEQDFVLKFKL